MPLGKGKDGDASLLGTERSADEAVCVYVMIVLIVVVCIDSMINE